MKNHSKLNTIPGQTQSLTLSINDRGFGKFPSSRFPVIKIFNFVSINLPCIFLGDKESKSRSISHEKHKGIRLTHKAQISRKLRATELAPPTLQTEAIGVVQISFIRDIMKCWVDICWLC